LIHIRLGDDFIMKQISKKHRVFKILTTAFLLGACIIFTTANAKADEGGFGIYTKTPGINLTAGDTASFDLFFTGLSSQGEDVSVSIESIPDGLSGYLKSGSYEVTKVHATSATDIAAVSLSLSTDAGVSQGLKEIKVKATTESGLEAKLSINVNISEKQAGESNFTVQYPDQEGVTGTVFSYSTTIINNSLTSQNYNFSTNAPDGWTVAFSSSDTQVSSLDVDAGASSGVKITVTPPDNAAAGTYPISCTATSAKETLTTDLNVTILGSYDLELTTSDGNLALDAYANKASDVTLVVKNNGNIDLENIQLSAKANSDWKVEFDESKIDKLAAGASQTVKAHITPGSNSITGDYVTDITASCDNKSDMTELRVTVKTSTGWGIFAVIIILAVVGCLYSVMKKYGRR